MEFEYEDFSLEHPTLRSYVIYDDQGSSKLVIELSNSDGYIAIALDQSAASKLNDFIMDFLFSDVLHENC